MGSPPSPASATVQALATRIHRVDPLASRPPAQAHHPVTAAIDWNAKPTGRRVMNGVHDMGGMHGFGPIVREANEPLFHAPTGRRASAPWQDLPGPGYFNSRCLPLWHRAHGASALSAGAVLRALARRSTQPDRGGLHDQRRTRGSGPICFASIPMPRCRASAAGAPRAESPASADLATACVALHGWRGRSDAQCPPDRPHPAAALRARQAGRHPRLHGPQIFPDTNAHGLGEHPQPLYNVRFDARELWGESAEPRQTVSLDLWESYLEPASG